MIFLLDECFPSKVWMHLDNLLKKHTFHQSVTLLGSGAQDIDIFTAAADKNIDALITSDIKQVENQSRLHERKACKDAGIHWVGVPRNPRAHGRSIPFSQVGQLLAAIPEVEKVLSQADYPQAVLLNTGDHHRPFCKGYPTSL